MTHGLVTRRDFIQQSAILLGAAVMAPGVAGQPIMLTRPEWQSFKTTSRYDSFVRAVRLMKANTNAADPNSWAYWINIHMNQCPHSTSYFLTWHRGYLYYFERQLRLVSGDTGLILPYWDYYTNPTIPAEFTNANGNNPLYAPRVNDNVLPALTMAPFASSLVNFPRGSTSAFESSFEDMPHNPVHNIIGNVMADMNSPTDPIFWLHHANVDRLWVAWVSAGGGRTMPAATNAYWSGSHTYTSTVAMLRSSTYSTRTTLGYKYQKETMPTSLPLVQSPPVGTERIQARAEDPAGAMPAVGSYAISSTRQTSDQTFAISGALDIGLANRSVSAQMPVSSEHMQTLGRIATGEGASLPGSTKRYQSVQLVLDQIELTDVGKQGGYYYQIYLNLPTADGIVSKSNAIRIGTLGAFEINSAAHHGGPAQLRYRIARAQFGRATPKGGIMAVSFVRVDGNRTPAGALIGLGEVRLEVSTEQADG
jgi:tyrosinase